MMVDNLILLAVRNLETVVRTCRHSIGAWVR